ncbi:hypothetical protein EHJ15_06645 [Cronobacter muytjensii]|nr:hypothetical protein [Cronobacter muytjensii]
MYKSIGLCTVYFNLSEIGAFYHFLSGRLSSSLLFLTVSTHIIATVLILINKPGVTAIGAI